MKRPLIIILILLFIFAIFFYFSLGTKPQFVGKESDPTPKRTLDSNIQKDKSYVFVEGQGYVLRDRKILLFTGQDTAQARKAEIIKGIEEELETYWKWQVLSGERSLEDIAPTNNERISKEKSSKNIISRILDVFKVANAINVVADTDKTCDCDDDLVLLAGRDLHLIKTILNPDGGAVGMGNPSDDPMSGQNTVLKISQHLKQSSQTDPKVGYGRKEPLLVGVIDSGINEGLANNMNPSLNYNFLNHIADVQDGSGHGTDVATVIVNNANTREIRIVGLKTHNDDNVGNLYDNLCAILYAIKYNIKVVNASWGTSFEDKVPVFEEVLRRAKAANIAIICSAGNDKVDIDQNAYYPACYTDNTELGSNVITVTSRNIDEKICQNKSVGGKKIDLSVLANADCKHIISGTIAKPGTSFAAPYVTADVVNYLLRTPAGFSKSGYISTISAGGAIKKYTNP
jgi:subtilisin family serine protease